MIKVHEVRECPDGIALLVSEPNEQERLAASTMPLAEYIKYLMDLKRLVIVKTV